MKVKFKLLRDTSRLPVYSTAGAAACDFFYTGDEPLTIPPESHAMVGTGLSVEIEEGFVLDLLPRSGLGAKHGIVLRNTIGLIDSDYRGEIMACVMNTSDVPFTLHPGDRFVQGRFLPTVVPHFEVVQELGDTSRSVAGFGSTGMQEPIRRSPVSPRSTHTLAGLGVTEGTYNEIANRLREAGWSHAFCDDGVDMSGILLMRQ